MIYRGFALVAVLALSLPAHAALIEYSFEAQLCGCNARFDFPPYTAFGLEDGDRITGGFVFDDAAPLTSYSEQPFGIWGTSWTAAYDMSALRLWANVGDYTFNATGTSLQMTNNPIAPIEQALDRWSLGTRGDGSESNGHTVDTISLSTRWLSDGIITSLEPQVIAREWMTSPTFDPSFIMRFTDGHAIVANVRNITLVPESVPEPATLSLLAVGALGAFAARRRRHVAAKA